MLVSELIKRGARQFSDQTAVLFADSRLTFAEVDKLSNRLANALRDVGKLDVGSRVGLLINNSIYSIPVDFACAKARLTRVPLNSRLALAEHCQMIENAGVTALVYGEDLKERAHDIVARHPSLKAFGLGCRHTGHDLVQLAHDATDQPPALVAEPDDVVLALYTSGTTGKLKAAQHTQVSWAAVGNNILTNLVPVASGEIMLHAASMIHASGTFILPFWVRGGTAAVLPGFASGDFLRAIERWRPTTLNLVPTMIGMLLEDPAAMTTDFSSLKTIIYGASPMPRATINKALALWGPRLIQYYGQTEAPLCISVLGKEAHIGEGASERLSSCGQPSVDCEIRLVDEDGADVQPGLSGEIAIRAPFAMTSYWDAEDLNAHQRLPGGWLRTRDVGRFDSSGFLHLVDRTSDMIVSGGYNVYPREVEDVLGGHPAVREVAVVGLPSDKWGEEVTAFVVLREQPPCSGTELIEFARDKLAGYKIPKSVRIINEVPKSAVGKILRRALRDPFWVGKERKI
jgi:acyl-CoA synthetase (AMP-forming)/AMP-acid ligase II